MLVTSAGDPEASAPSTTDDFAGRARPMYFGAPDELCLGWWHEANRTASFAVVICAPFGLEDLSAYRSLKHLAHSLAAAGLPVLRFDYAGCGDSTGNNDEGDQVPKWIDSIQAAADLARSLSGAARVAFVGVRLGALLAATVAGKRQDVGALVAIAPPASGRAFVRECRMLGAAAGVGDARGDGGIQAGGFVLSGPTCDSLSGLSLPKTGPSVAPTALVIDRDDMAPCLWGQQLAPLGTRVVQETQPGFAAMVDSPHYAVTPLAMMARVVQWLGECSAEASMADSDVNTPVTKPLTAEHAVLALDGQRLVREQPTQIARFPRLIGQLTEPHPSAHELHRPPLAQQHALLILNTGSERRIGPNRLWVSFARERAARGEIVLRLDQAGVGESDGRLSAPENDVYSAEVLGDIATALTWLKDHHHVTHCTVLGVCSGAYHGFQAALAGLPVNRVISINPLLFHWHPNISLRDTATHPGGQLEHMAHASQGLRDPKKWVRLIRGQIDVSGLMRVLAARGRRRLALQARNFARAIGHPLNNDLAHDLQSITKHSISIQFVFSRGDPGQIILREEAGETVDHLQRNNAISINFIEDADHTFTAASARARLWLTLHDLLDKKDRAVEPLDQSGSTT